MLRLLFFTFALALVASCGGDATPAPSDTPVLVVAERLSDPDRSFVDQIVSLQQASDWDALGTEVGFTRQPCHAKAPDDPSPPCESGESDGTVVEAFFYGFCHSGFVRPAPEERVIRENAGFANRATTFYGVVRGHVAEYLDADYDVIFAFTDAVGQGKPDGYWYTVRNQRIVAESRTCGSLEGSFGPDPNFLVEPD